MMQKQLDRFLSTVSQSYSRLKVLTRAKLSATKPVLSDFQSRVLTNAKFSNVQKQLDDVFSITEVRDAQVIVHNVEREFLEARRLASQAKKELSDVRISLEEARKTLDRCPRDSENFLKHVAEEHAIINKEKRLRGDHEMKELRERELFTEYSNAVRVSHEKERERAQKTKYLSIVASVSGAVIGFLGSSLLTYYRMKQLRKMQSSELIISEISNEIRENKLTNEELEKIFEANTEKLVHNLTENLKVLSDEKLQLLNVNDDLVEYVNMVEKTGQVIKNSEMEIKKQLDSHVLKATKISESIISGMQNNTEIMTVANEKIKDSMMVDINKQLRMTENRILKDFDAKSSRVIDETSKALKEEYSKIYSNQNELRSHIINNRTLTDENPNLGKIPKPNSTLDSDEAIFSWYPEANLILSFFSFGLLVYLAVTKN